MRYPHNPLEGYYYRRVIPFITGEKLESKRSRSSDRENIDHSAYRLQHTVGGISAEESGRYTSTCEWMGTPATPVLNSVLSCQMYLESVMSLRVELIE
jgi:hypothetical protein